MLLWQMAVGPAGSSHARGEARELAERDASRLLRAEGIAAAELIPLERAGDLHPLPYDWLLVVRVEDKPGSQRPLDDLYEDLRSANANPVLLSEAGHESRE
jgi:hypothetical protein